MRYSSRFWLYAPLAVALTLLAAAMLYWWVLVRAIDRKLDALNGHPAVPGITLSYTAKTISGFPFNIDIVFTGFAVTGRGAHGPFSWTSEKFALHRLTYGRAQDIYEAAGTQTVRWTDGGGRAHALKFLPATLRASAIVDARGLARFDMDVMDAGGTDGDGTPFTAGRAQFHLRRRAPDLLDLMISGDEIKTAGNIAGLFGNHIQTLRLYASLTRAAAFAPLLAGRQAWPQAAAAWRAASGQVTVGPVAIQSAGLNLNANAFADTGHDLGGLLEPLY